MARLFTGEKEAKADRVYRTLKQHWFGLSEFEIACELGWERRTVNNYLRELAQQGKIYKEGQSWFAEE